MEINSNTRPNLGQSSSSGMKYLHAILAVVALAFTLTLPMPSLAQSDSSRLDELEQRLARVEHRAGAADNRTRDNGAAGLAAFVCAAFCALWAQQTSRNAWLWFFLGAFFNFITLLVLLYKNSKDKRQSR